MITNRLVVMDGDLIIIKSKTSYHVNAIKNHLNNWLERRQIHNVHVETHVDSNYQDDSITVLSSTSLDEIFEKAVLKGESNG